MFYHPKTLAITARWTSEYCASKTWYKARPYRTTVLAFQMADQDLYPWLTHWSIQDLIWQLQPCRYVRCRPFQDASRVLVMKSQGRTYGIELKTQKTNMGLHSWLNSSMHTSGSLLLQRMRWGKLQRQVDQALSQQNIVNWVDNCPTGGEWHSCSDVMGPWQKNKSITHQIHNQTFATQCLQFDPFTIWGSLHWD